MVVYEFFFGSSFLVLEALLGEVTLPWVTRCFVSGNTVGVAFPKWRVAIRAMCAGPRTRARKLQDSNVVFGVRMV